MRTLYTYIRSSAHFRNMHQMDLVKLLSPCTACCIYVHGAWIQGINIWMCAVSALCVFRGSSIGEERNPQRYVTHVSLYMPTSLLRRPTTKKNCDRGKWKVGRTKETPCWNRQRHLCKNNGAHWPSQTRLVTSQNRSACFHFVHTFLSYTQLCPSIDNRIHS